jgi:hypothetical protein
MRNRSLQLRVVLVAGLAAAVLLTAIVGAPSPAGARAAQARAVEAPDAESARAVAPATCPDSSPWTDGGSASQPKSERPGSMQTLVPDAPASALICVYNGLPEPGVHAAAFGLVGQRTLSAAGTGQLAQAFDALAPFPSGAISCPADEGMGATVYFGYATGSDAQISVSTSGCSSSSNGYLTRLSFPPVIGGVHGSTAFIRAHEATVTGRVCDAALRPRCDPPKLAHLSVELSSDHLWRDDLAIRGSRFSGYTTPGTTTITVIQNFGAAHPDRLATARRSVAPGRAATVTLWVQ